MKRAPIFGCAVSVLVLGVALSASAQEKGSQRPTRQALATEQDTAGNEVNIAPTTLPTGSTSIDVGGDHWSARGFNLKTLIAQVYNIDERRIDLAEDTTGDARYDMTLTLTHEIDEDAMQQMLEHALEQKFGLAIGRQSKWMDVYVLTAPNGPGMGLRPHATSRLAKVAAVDGPDTTDDVEEIKFLGKKCDGVSSGGIMASAGTLGEFRRTLEPDLDRLLVDETGLKGSYDFHIGKYDNEGELFQLLWEQLGIAVSREQRSVTVLNVRPTGRMTGL